MEDRRAWMMWFQDAVPEHLFPQIAAQVLFQCQSCDECCRGEGYAQIDQRDLQRIARCLDLGCEEAAERFTDPDPGRSKDHRALKSTGPDGSCCFLDTSSRRCRIYDCRPAVCRAFPMLLADMEGEEAISLYPDCLGTAAFVRMVLEKGRDLQVQRDVKELGGDEERIMNLRLMLYVRYCQICGMEEEAERICRTMGIGLPFRESAFKRDCLVYFLMTTKIGGLKGYRYEPHAKRGGN